MDMPAPASVLILGGGFGGLYTALIASRLLSGRAELTIIDRNDYFLYTPLLFQVAGGTLEAHHVARPLKRLLPRSVRIVRADVTAIDVDAKQVAAGGESFAYDYLVLALGGVPNFYGMATAERHALPFKWLPDVFHLRDHIEQRFAEAAAEPRRARDVLRTVVTGAGCTGVELVAELHDWMSGPLLRQYPSIPQDAPSLVLAEAFDHLLCPMDPNLMREAVRKLLDRRIDLRLGRFVSEVGPGWLKFRGPSGDEQVPCGTVVWTAGIKPAPIIADLALPRGPGGRIEVSPTLQVTGHPTILVLGDLAACPDPAGGLLPQTAQVAVQQGPAAARTLAALIVGKDPPAFHYRRKGEVVGLGRMGALAEAFGIRLAGLPAWLFSRTVHLARVPDWGDRVAIALQWVKALLESERR